MELNKFHSLHALNSESHSNYFTSPVNINLFIIVWLLLVLGSTGKKEADREVNTASNLIDNYSFRHE